MEKPVPLPVWRLGHYTPYITIHHQGFQLNLQVLGGRLDTEKRSNKNFNSLLFNYHIATLLEESRGTGSVLLLPGHLALLCYKQLNTWTKTLRRRSTASRSFLVRFSWSLKSLPGFARVTAFQLLLHPPCSVCSCK